MLGVEIRSGGAGWVDHLGNPIDRLSFSKEHCRQYIPGHYPIESFGSLYRNIDDFRQSPIQSLTDWEIRIPSVYSSEDGQFQTIDLFYHLEAENEEVGGEFNIIGCEAVLLDGGAEIYRGVVNSVSTSGGATSIIIGERMGAPEIKKSEFPISLGSADVSYWPVKFERNGAGQSIIQISDRPLAEFGGFFTKIDGELVPVDMNVGNQMVDVSLENATAIFTEPESVAYTLDRFIFREAPFNLNMSALTALRHGASDPDDYVAGEGINAEFVQAWSNCLFLGSEPMSYSLGRALPASRRSHYSGDKIKKAVDPKANEIEIELTSYPVSLAFGAIQGNTLLFSTHGNPSFFFDASRNSLDDSQIAWDEHPTIECNPRKLYHPNAGIHVGFPEISGLPSSAAVVGSSISYRLIRQGSFNLSSGSFYDFIGDGEWHSFPISFISPNHPYPMSGLRRIDISFAAGAPYDHARILKLGALKLHLKIRMPLGDAKLYAKGKIAGADFAEPGNTLIPAVKGLLASANVKGYSVRKAEGGELSGIEYGHAVSGEAVAMRDKLRSLAAESATLVKFSPAGEELLLKSVSRQFDHETIGIPLNAIALENNIYGFKMESPYRGDILGGISVSWGKDIETGKYGHAFSVEPGGRFSMDGDLWDPSSGLLGGDKWSPVISQLGRNSASGIGIMKSLDADWVANWEGAEIMAYNFLCWNCAPLRKAQLDCITPVLRSLGEEIDIGSFIFFSLPGYPEKLKRVAWAVTGIHDDLDGKVSSLELLEAWNMPVLPPERFLLLEDGRNILLEDGMKIKLEDLYG
jgi:hypothetical protein